MPEASPGLPEVIHIRWNDFHSCLFLDHIPKLPKYNFIRLVKIMSKDPDRNREAAAVLRVWAKRYASVTKQAHDQAAQEDKKHTAAAHKKALRILQVINQYLF